LEIAATCTVAELLAFALQPDRPWPGARAVMAGCCRAFSSSLKVWNTATVGGNVCLALPAAPMVSMATALHGMCVLRAADGRERQVPAGAFVTGAGRTDLRPGEMLRCLRLPAEGLTRRTAMRRVSLRPGGHSAALVIAASAPGSRHFTCTVTAATTRPVHLTFDRLPAPAGLRAAIGQALEATPIVDDAHGDPTWRRHLTYHLAEEARQALAATED
jgi:CO/xanthine dehydrogenase FAD-binding subunit